MAVQNLPLGYYRCYIRSGSQGSWSKPLTFARIVDAASRKLNSDMPYAVGSILADFVRFLPQDSQKLFAAKSSLAMVADLEKLAGIGFVREYMCWGDLNPQPGEFAWGGRYGTMADLYSQRGIRAVAFVVTPPEWACSKKYPSMAQDLMALYRFFREAASQFKGSITAWELGNEFDGGGASSSGGPGWEYAAAMKAAYLGVKAGNPAATFVFIAGNNVMPLHPWTHMVMRNGVAGYFDAFNFHWYPPLAAYPGGIQSGVQAQRDFLGEYGIVKPIWITENGLIGEGDGACQPYLPAAESREHDEDQERQQAEFVVKSQITMQSLGIARDFSFVFPPFCEGGKVWGLLRLDGTVKPGYVALANLTQQLGWSRFLGVIDLAPEVSGFLFADPDGSQTVVAWAKGSERTVTFPNGIDHVRIVDLLGTETQVATEKGECTLVVGKYPVYWRGLRDLKPSRPALAAGADSAAAESTTDKEVVLRIVFKESQEIQGRTAVLLDQPSVCQAGLEILNFGKAPKVVRLRNLGKGYRLEAAPAKTRVPAMESRTVPITIRLAAPVNVVLKVGATVGRKRVSPIEVPLVPPLLNNSAYRALRLPTEDASRWRANSSGKM